MNPRYLAYCRAHRLSPEQMMEQDRYQWPGGVMCGFIIWHSERIAEAKAERPDLFFMGNLVKHEAYNRWLNNRY